MIQGYVFIILAAASWAFIGIFSHIAFKEGIQPMEVAFWRAIIASLFFGFRAAALKEYKIKAKDAPLLLIFALFGISLFYVSYQVAFKHLGTAFAAVLLYTAPAWVVLVSLFVHNEEITRLKALSVVLVVLGVFLISKTGGNNASLTGVSVVGIAAGLTAGFCYSLYYTMGKYFTKVYSSSTLFLWMLSAGAMGILPFTEFSDKTPAAWAALAALAFVSTFMANTFYYQGLKKIEAGRASLVATLEPVIAALAAYIFFGEYFTILGYAGAGMIIAAVVLTIYS